MTGSEYWSLVPTDERGVLNQEEYRRVCLSAIDEGDFICNTVEVSRAGVAIDVMTLPFAIGTSEDFVICYGLSARTVDSIAFELGMISPTPKLFDLSRHGHSSTPYHRVGPFVGDNSGYNGMLKSRAFSHSRSVQNVMLSNTRVGGVGKTYCLGAPEKLDRYATTFGIENRALIYGWSVTTGGRSGVSLGRVIQPPRYAHVYDFFDYSMCAYLISPEVSIDDEVLDVRDILIDSNHTHLSRVSHNGAVPYIIHPLHELMQNDYNDSDS